MTIACMWVNALVVCAMRQGSVGVVVCVVICVVVSVRSDDGCNVFLEVRVMPSRTHD